jgi:hypothetical protein
MQVPWFSPRILYISSKSSGRVFALVALPSPALLLEDNGLEMQA